MNALDMTRDERIEALVHRDGLSCQYPGCEKPLDKEDITFDHWIPQSKGGTWDLSNLKMMHKKCNAIKGDRMPNPDGTLPPLKREVALANRRAVRRGNRPEVCNVCESGRKLGPDEECASCGSGPMPEVFPRWAKMRSNECDHELFWCWACSIGITPRRAAIVTVLDGEYLDEAG